MKKTERCALFSMYLEYRTNETFSSLLSLFQVYGHRVAKAIEYMVGDALAAADPVLKISHALDDPRE